MKRHDRTLAMMALALAATWPVQTALAQVAPAKAGAEKPAADKATGKAAAAAAAQKAYASGTKLFESGKYKEALPLLSQALGTPGLPSQQMAKALYYRGVANRKLGKPAQAMSDLTTAVWVSGGLSDSDRAQALENRQAAYREAGLGDQAPDIPAPPPPRPQPVAAAVPPPAPAPAAPAAATPAPSIAAAPAAPAVYQAPSPAAKPAAIGSLAPSAPLPPAAAAPAAPSAGFATTVQSSSPQPAAEAPRVARIEPGVPNPFGDPVGGASSAPPAAAMSAAPAEPAPAAPAASGPTALEKAGTSIAAAGNSVTGFFSNMFKSGEQASAPAQQPLAAPVAGTEPQTSASPVMTAANPDGSAAGWGAATAVSPGKDTRVAAAGMPVSTGAIAAPSPPAASKSAGGKFLLQIAAVRSRAEAEQIADRVRQQHGGSLTGRELLVDEAVIGNFGSFHRVRVGPYANAKEPGSFCSKLIKTGFDCLVVTQ